MVEEVVEEDEDDVDVVDVNSVDVDVDVVDTVVAMVVVVGEVLMTPSVMRGSQPTLMSLNN